MQNRSLRVAIVAPHASARFGGESILPLHYFRQLRARGIEAWMVLHERTRPELEELLGEETSRIHFVRDLPSDRWLHRLSGYLPARVAENTLGMLMRLTTQWRQRAVLRELVETQRIDVVHEPSPVSPRRPSLIFDVGAPVVIGPMNGGMTYPEPFAHLERRSERWFVGVARRSTHWMNRLVPGKRRAAVLLVANERTRRALPVDDPERAIELVENGVDFGVFDARDVELERPVRSPVVLVFSGRLVAWKGVDLLLEVLARLQGLDFELRILGDGVERPRLEETVRALGLTERVRFLGFVPQRECARQLADADIFVLPSVYECGGAVVLEAMAMGVPVVAHRWGGPADYLNEECGILLDPRQARADLVRSWEDALRYLIGRPEVRAHLGRAGYTRVRAEFSWQKKIDAICSIYERAAAQFESVG